MGNLDHEYISIANLTAAQVGVEDLSGVVVDLDVRLVYQATLRVVGNFICIEFLHHLVNAVR